MSKMGRYVFQIQEETEQDDYRDRERGSDAGEDETTRSAVQQNGDWRFFCGSSGNGQSEAGASTEATSDPIPEKPPAKKIQRRSGR